MLLLPSLEFSVEVSLALLCNEVEICTISIGLCSAAGSHLEIVQLLKDIHIGVIWA